MRLLTVFSALLVSATVVATSTGCSSPADRREYTLQGQVLSLTSDHKEATIKHEDIKGLMPAMTMPYHVRDGKEFEGIAAGDLVTATLVVVSNDAYLKDVKKVGSAPLEKPAAQAQVAPTGFELLRDGQPIPNAQFIDQDGRERDFASFQGSALLVTFVYTRCPMPTFCPLMDRHFGAIQQELKKDRALNVHLVTISFDPENDTPAVLKTHASDLGADPRLWTFLTGDRDVIDRFAARFGVSVVRATNEQKDITHNLRTAIVDRQGNLVKVYTGNEWTPGQALADIKVMVGVD
jgi:protein SCO1